jgi:Cathepsin propeptide inhibitor domain (I29)
LDRYLYIATRQYANKREEKKRYNQFQESLLRIDNLNDLEKSRNGTAIFGITTMADLSLEEFTKEYLGGRPTEMDEDERRSLKESPLVQYDGFDTGVQDWTGVLTTPIKSQGQCASCW